MPMAVPPLPWKGFPEAEVGPEALEGCIVQLHLESELTSADRVGKVVPGSLGPEQFPWPRSHLRLCLLFPGMCPFLESWADS